MRTNPYGEQSRECSREHARMVCSFLDDDEMQGEAFRTRRVREEECMNRLIITASVGFLVFMVFFPVVVFSIDGNAVLVKVDEVLSASTTSVASATMTLVDRDGSSKERSMVVWTRHFKDRDDWSLLKFTRPAELRNLGFLSLADDQMYLYLPAFDRVRRIASTARKESFAGSDLSNDDLSTGKFTRHYDALIMQETQREYVLELTRKDGSDRIYARVVAWVDKEHFTTRKMELYEDRDKLWKTNEMVHEQIQGYWTPVQITVKDVTKDHTTIMKITQIVYDTDLDETVFSTRYLKRNVKVD